MTSSQESKTMIKTIILIALLIGGCTQSYNPPEPKLMIGGQFLKPKSVVSGQWKYDKKPLIVVTYLINNQTYPRGIPNLLDLEVCMKKPLRPTWSIWSISLLERNGMLGRVKDLTIVQDFSDDNFELRESFSGFRKDHCDYLIEVRLHAKNNMGDEEKRKAVATLNCTINLVPSGLEVVDYIN